MTRKELEKIFDEKFPFTDIHYSNEPMWGKYEVPFPSEAKQFIFETIIPEVLKSILGLDEGSGYYDIHLTNAIKREAKELYGIDL